MKVPEKIAEGIREEYQRLLALEMDGEALASLSHLSMGAREIHDAFVDIGKDDRKRTERLAKEKATGVTELLEALPDQIKPSGAVIGSYGSGEALSPSSETENVGTKFMRELIGALSGMIDRFKTPEKKDTLGEMFSAMEKAKELGLGAEVVSALEKRVRDAVGVAAAGVPMVLDAGFPIAPAPTGYPTSPLAPAAAAEVFSHTEEV